MPVPVKAILSSSRVKLLKKTINANNIAAAIKKNLAGTGDGSPVWGGTKSKNPRADGIRVDAGVTLDPKTIKKEYPNDPRPRRRCKVQINKDPEESKFKKWLGELKSTHKDIAILDIPIDDGGRPSIELENADDLIEHMYVPEE